MKNIMKLSLIIASCISATAYSAEKLNADKIIRESHAAGKPIPVATIDQLLRQGQENLARDAVSFKMLLGQQISEITIAQADVKTAALARQHNQSLQQKLDPEQLK